jgi:hypothetical protein
MHFPLRGEQRSRSFEHNAWATVTKVKIKSESDMSFFTPVDTANASTFLKSVNQADGSFVEHLLMPVTSFDNNGHSAMPNGLGKDYDLYLTIDATGKGTTFASLNVTLWADPTANDGKAFATATGGAAFSHGTTGDIALATGTMVSAQLNFDPATGIRHADFVELLTPTLAGTRLSDGSIKAGSLLEEQLTTPPAVFQAIPQADGSIINLLNGGSAKVDSPIADATSYTNNVYSLVQADGSFVSHRIDPVTGFSLNGNPVVPAGFGSTYGMYLDIVDTGVSTPTSLTFSSSSFRLMLDPGNHDGTVTSTTGGIAFANLGATGAADDIVLGTGTMISGVAGIDPATGSRTTHFIENYGPAPGQFPLSPVLTGAAVFDLLNTTKSGLLINTPAPNGTIIQTINGGVGEAKSIPEIGAGQTLLVATIPPDILHHRLGFIYGPGRDGHIIRS